VVATQPFEHGGQVGGQLRLEGHRLMPNWVLEGEAPGVQELPGRDDGLPPSATLGARLKRRAGCPSPAVETVADHRVADGRQVYADLATA